MGKESGKSEAKLDIKVTDANNITTIKNLITNTNSTSEKSRSSAVEKDTKGKNCDNKSKPTNKKKSGSNRSGTKENKDQIKDGDKNGTADENSKESVTKINSIHNTTDQVPPSPKRSDATSNKNGRSGRTSSLRRRNRDKNSQYKQSNSGMDSSPTASPDMAQIISAANKLDLGKDHLMDNDRIYHSEVNSYVSDNTNSNTAVYKENGTRTETQTTTTAPSPQILNDLVSSPTMTYPPFHFMPIQPNLYPLFMPAQMQDGRFVFVPVAYPMPNNNQNKTNSGYPTSPNQNNENTDTSSGTIPTPMYFNHPDYRFLHQDGNFSPSPYSEHMDADLHSTTAYRYPNQQAVPTSPLPWSGSWPHMGALPVLDHSSEVNTAYNYAKQGYNMYGTSPNNNTRSYHNPYSYPSNYAQSNYGSDNGRSLSDYHGSGSGILDISTEALESLNREAEEICKRLSPDPVEDKNQQQLLQLLKNHCHKVFPEAQLHPFGSTANGLGLANADMDLCVCFPKKATTSTGRIITAVEFVESLGAVLQRDPDLTEIKVLTRTRIPIIKLKHKNGVASDIGFENRLALYNTRLLKLYNEVDRRFKNLVCLVKHWSKQRNINEPYRGTLSSYCYVLMVIFYLQQRSPPVLPCLQQLPLSDSNKGSLPEHMVDGHNVYFLDDLTKIKRPFKDMSKHLPTLHEHDEGKSHEGKNNEESIAELLFGFFHYYAYSFHWSKSVVSVRLGRTLSKDEKGWTKAKYSASPSTGASVADRYWLCVEDPFELNHNLGRPADKNAVYEIRGEFIRAAKMLKSRDSNQALARLFQTYQPSQDPTPNSTHHNIHPYYNGYPTPQYPQPYYTNNSNDFYTNRNNTYPNMQTTSQH